MPFHLILPLAFLFNSLASAQSVKSVDDLIETQAAIRAVVRENTGATVGLLSARTGGSGSGVIVSKEGLILTAAHVIEGSETVEVIFPDGRTTRGTVLGFDRTRDQGMVQIAEKADWPFVQLGSSVEKKPGDWVVALGHPGGYDPVRTPPVRLGRILSINAVGFFTTDCKLIGGDSGGPLFDLEGKLVGIHSSIGGSRTTSVNNHAGISDFVVSWDRLKSGERWGTYGVIDIPEGPMIGIVFDMRLQRFGVRVDQVVKGGPAAIGGIRPGDHIIAIDDEEIDSPSALKLRIAQRRPGDEVNVKVLRRGKVMDTVVVLVQRNQLR